MHVQLITPIVTNLVFYPRQITPNHSAEFDFMSIRWLPSFLLLPIMLLIVWPCAARAEHEGKVQILLLGDSTTEASIPKRLVPKGPHFEDVIRLLLAAEKDLPPTNVINLGQSGETIERLMKSGRYDKSVAKLPGIDYVFIRYGLNDRSKREDFVNNFPKDFHELLARLRKDFPTAVLIPTTVIPYGVNDSQESINALVRKVAEEEKLPLFDLHPRYLAELKKGPNMLNYRRFPLDKIPEKHHEWLKPFTYGTPPAVEVNDNRLDAHFGDLPGWYGDRHPNSAGYHVIADETAKYLMKMMRERQK
jgi:lysophospholipase L1-like esterase